MYVNNYINCYSKLLRQSMFQNINGIPSLARTNLVAIRNMLQLIWLIRDELLRTL